MRLLRGQIRQLMDWQQQYLPRTLRKQQPFLTVCRLEQYGKYIINTPTSCKVWLFLRFKRWIEEGFLLMGKFGRVLRLMNRLRQKCSFLAG